MEASAVAPTRPRRRRFVVRRRVMRSFVRMTVVTATVALASEVYAATPSKGAEGVVWWDPATWHDTDDHDDTPAPTPSTSAAPTESEPLRSPSVAAANARGMAGLMVVVGVVLAGVAWARYRARPEAAFLAELRAPVGKVLLGYAIDSEVERDADTVVFRATHVASGAPVRVCLVRPEHVADRARAAAHDERARAWAIDSRPGRRVREVLRERGEIVIVLEA